jgi:hypothetical protein
MQKMSKIRTSRCAKARLELAVFRSNSGIIPGALPSCTSKVHTRNFVFRFLWRLYITLIIYTSKGQYQL